ncbi:MAG: transcription antitermination factor NusB [Bacteroidales bacterium]|nr:transcription antitermination factor NusB [Bacteroidales bacterium]
MLYRRHLRIKALQALYEWFSGSVDDLPKGERQLFQSIDKVYELFIYQLSFLLEIKRFAQVRIEENKNKYYPTQEDLNPNLKFIENKVLNLLEENRDFLKKEAALKINWAVSEEMVLKFYLMMRNADFYKKYMADPNLSLDEDKKFIIKVIDRLMSDFDLLRSHYDEIDMYYGDGYDLTDILLVKFMDTISPKFGADTKLPAIYNTADDKVNEDRIFVQALYRKVILNNEEYSQIIEGKTRNWDYDRIPLIDVILLKMAIVELREMPTIPVKVTMNEYIELAKYFSTQKSKIFINGVLDKLIVELKEQGLIQKQGRGLLE